MNIYEKLLEIQKETHLDKPEKNKFADFMYRTIEQVLNFLKPLFSKHKLFVYFGDSIINQETKTLSITLNILDMESNAKDFNKIQIIKEIFIDLGKAKMDDSQKVNSAETFAKKRILENLFLINTEPDPDSLDNTQNINSPKLVNQDQLKKMFAMMKQAGISNDQMKKSLKTKYNLESSKDLNHDQLNEIFSFLEHLIKEKKKHEPTPDIMGDLGEL